MEWNETNAAWNWLVVCWNLIERNSLRQNILPLKSNQTTQSIRPHCFSLLADPPIQSLNYSTFIRFHFIQLSFRFHIQFLIGGLYCYNIIKQTRHQTKLNSFHSQFKQSINESNFLDSIELMRNWWIENELVCLVCRFVFWIQPAIPT